MDKSTLITVSDASASPAKRRNELPGDSSWPKAAFFWVGEMDSCYKLRTEV